MEALVVKWGHSWKSYHTGQPSNLTVSDQPRKEELNLQFLKWKRDGGKWKRSQHLFQGGSIYEWPAVCWASEQSAFENPASCVLEGLRIRKCSQPFRQSDRTGLFLQDRAPGVLPINNGVQASTVPSKAEQSLSIRATARKLYGFSLAPSFPVSSPSSCISISLPSLKSWRSKPMVPHTDCLGHVRNWHASLCKSQTNRGATLLRTSYMNL